MTEELRAPELTADLTDDHHEMVNQMVGVVITPTNGEYMGQSFRVLPGGVPIKNRWRHELERVDE